MFGALSMVGGGAVAPAQAADMFCALSMAAGADAADVPPTPPSSASAFGFLGGGGAQRRTDARPRHLHRQRQADDLGARRCGGRDGSTAAWRPRAGGGPSAGTDRRTAALPARHGS